MMKETKETVQNRRDFEKELLSDSPFIELELVSPMDNTINSMILNKNTIERVIKDSEDIQVYKIITTKGEIYNHFVG